MRPNQHLSKLNPNHPIHFQNQGKVASNNMPIKKEIYEQISQDSVDSDSPTGPEQKLYKQALHETLLGTVILVIVGAYTLFGLHNQLQEESVRNILCDLHKRELRILFGGLLITEGLMIVCVGLGMGFRIRRAVWKANGRHRTVNEKAGEVLAVLAPFYLGAVVGTVTLVFMWLGRLMAKDVECSGVHLLVSCIV